jgi:hypothetical protein
MRKERPTRTADDMFFIYQIRDDAANARDIRFASMEMLRSLGRAPDMRDYELVHAEPFDGPAESKADRLSALEEIYRRFNEDLPENFKGRSVSVSDVIAIRRSGKVSVFYVDSIGFAELDFTDEREETEPEEKDEDIQALADDESVSLIEMFRTLEYRGTTCCVAETRTGLLDYVKEMADKGMRVSRLLASIENAPYAELFAFDVTGYSDAEAVPILTKRELADLL